MLLSNILKISAVAAFAGFGVAAAVAPAAAATYETRCYGDDCYRVRCDDFGYACRRMEYMGDVGYTRHRDRLMCDADGDDCRWVRTRVYNYDYDDDDDFYGD